MARADARTGARGDASESPSSSLEPRTKLARRAEGIWQLTLYPEAGEAGGQFRSAAGSSPAAGPGPASDSTADAVRRARGKLRRFCTANGLNRLGTLTYAGEGCHDPLVLRSDVGRFWKRLRTSVGRDLPYAWVPEWHKTGHGLHVHFAVGRYIDRGAIVDAWRQGFVHIKLLVYLPVGTGTFGEARRTGRYLAKYVGKDFGSGVATGLHRYEVAEGFQPRSFRIEGSTASEALEWASVAMGAEPERIWRSSEEEGWQGPPAVWASWA